METVDEVLEHFGVKGMHWGVRRDKTTGGFRLPSRKPQAPSTKDAARARKLQTRAKTKGVHTLSNAELKALNERLNLEQNYGNLTSKNSYSKKASDEGQSFAKNVLLGSGQELAKKVLVQKGAAALVKRGLLVAKGG